MTGKYDDIIALKHHVSAVHPHMSMHDRAAQFAPFSPLSAHGAALLETARAVREEVERENAPVPLDEESVPSGEEETFNG